MKRFISMLLTVSMLSMPFSVYAEESESHAIVTPLSKDQPAPWPGILFSTDAVAKVIADKEAAEKEKELAVQHQIDLSTAQLKFEIDKITSTCIADKSILTAQLEYQKNQVKILNDQIKNQSSGPTPVTWLALGTGAGVVLTVLTVFAISQAQK